MAGRAVRRWLLVLLLLVAACGGGGGDDDAAPVDAGGGSAPKATLGIITTEIETALGAKPFAEASEGQQLDIGDRVRTDTTGFAEITYHDGSWQRVEAEATLTILALSADDTVNTVRTGHDIGRTWNNVQELDDPDDTYEVRTPVATAAVRGTSFATDCPTNTNCTFTVLDGRIRLTPTTGDPLTLTAGQTLTITDQGPQGDPTDADQDDPWITKNQDLDTERAGGDAPTSGGVRRIGISACAAFSEEEVQFVASQRDDGRDPGEFTQSDTYGRDMPPEGVVSSQCSWSGAGSMRLDENFLDAGRVQLDLMVANDFGSCGIDADLEPPPGGEPVTVGDEGRWYPDRRLLIAYRDGVCAALRHQSMDAGTAGRDAFADAVQRILTRVVDGIVTPTEVESSPGVG
jgi:hypothetical protein